MICRCVYTNSNEHNFIKSCFSMFSCILSFDDMLLFLFILIVTSNFYKIVFFDVFMHFELR